MHYAFDIDGQIVEKNSRPGKGEKVYRSVNVVCDGFVERIDLPDTPAGAKMWADLPDVGANIRIVGKKVARWFNGQGSANLVAEKLQAGAVQSTGAKAA